MAWDFETDPYYQQLLDWADQFVRNEVEPLDLLWPRQQFTPPTGKRKELLDRLKQQV
ncbi:MAG: acyl-CoA dehydrogenase, partial [Acidimicrobiia bacterium]|nr:acyl-CoA dehydrogenase [Acidimicrobiia bacterium]